MQREAISPGQESVWDYPRPPRLEPVTHTIEIDFGGRTIVRTTSALRVLETSHPPVYYVPMADIAPGVLVYEGGSSWCEFKGRARYYGLAVDGRIAPGAAWGYDDPSPAFRELVDHVAFYPSKMDACRVNGETARAQPGDFYGGWITDAIKGPFKGGAGTFGW